MLYKAKNTKSKGYKLNRFIQVTGKDWVKRHLDIMSLSFNDSKKNALLINGEYPSLESMLHSDIMSATAFSDDILKAVRYLDKNISLEGDMLVKVDRTSMLNSIECRAPYLDHRLMEFSYQIPDNFLINGQNKKRILKDTFSDMLPKDFFSASKSGFEMPIGDWFRAELK
jgi:asparagine synthase (glutamine-hydrolysing)